MRSFVVATGAVCSTYLAGCRSSEDKYVLCGEDPFKKDFCDNRREDFCLKQFILQPGQEPGEAGEDDRKGQNRSGDSMWWVCTPWRFSLKTVNVDPIGNDKKPDASNFVVDEDSDMVDNAGFVVKKNSDGDNEAVLVGAGWPEGSSLYQYRDTEFGRYAVKNIVVRERSPDGESEMERKIKGGFKRSDFKVEVLNDETHTGRVMVDEKFHKMSNGDFNF